jgi:hypothetical protein
MGLDYVGISSYSPKRTREAAIDRDAVEAGVNLWAKQASD